MFEILNEYAKHLHIYEVEKVKIKTLLVKGVSLCYQGSSTVN